MATIKLCGSSQEIDADLYAQLEMIRASEQKELSMERLEEMIALCDTPSKKRDLRLYAVGKLGVKAKTVFELIPGALPGEVTGITIVANAHAKRVTPARAFTGRAAIFH